MSVVFSGTNQGFFTSTGAAQIIQVPSGVDYIHTYNQTQIAANSVSTSYECYWQLGMASGGGLNYESNAGATAVNITPLAAGSGFTLVNNTVNVPGALVALTAISNATPPVVSTGSTAGLVANSSIVRLFNVTGAQQIGGVDFTVGTIVANTSFTLAYMRSIAAATTGNYRIIPYNPYFYPPTRVISKISQAAQAIVTMTVTHAFTVGQKVRFVIPAPTASAFGMTQLNGVEATIVAVGQADTNGVTNTITVNVDTTGFTAFAWPTTTDPFSTFPQVVPVGQNMAQSILSGTNQIGDSEVNQGYIGVQLAAGANAPAGVANDVIFWVAGKSVNT